jgi:hypothetical protein
MRAAAGKQEIEGSQAERRRLASWKEIADYAGVSVATVQRWEKSEHLPVHRHMHCKIGSVYGFTDEFDTWLLGRDAVLTSLDAE